MGRAWKEELREGGGGKGGMGYLRVVGYFGASFD